MKKSDILRNVVDALLNKKTGRFYVKKEKEKKQLENFESFFEQDIPDIIFDPPKIRAKKKIVLIEH